MPFQDAPSNTVVPAGTRTSPPSGANRSFTRAGVCSAIGSSTAVIPLRDTSAAWRARNALIHAMPYSSRACSTSAARAPATHSGERASMIADVRPCVEAVAMKWAPSAWRPGMPKLVLEAPQVVFTPSSSRIRRSVSKKSTAARGSAPIGIASASITMSSGGMP